MKISIEHKVSRRQFLKYAMIGFGSSILPTWVYTQAVPVYESEYLKKRAMQMADDMVTEMIAESSQDMRHQIHSNSAEVYTNILLRSQELGFVKSETGVYQKGNRAFQGFESANSFNLAMPFFDVHQSNNQYRISNPLIIGGPIFFALSEIVQMWYMLDLSHHVPLPAVNAIFPSDSDTPLNLLKSFLQSFSFPYIYKGKQFNGYQTATHVMYETKYPQYNVGVLTFTLALLRYGQGENIIIPPTSYDISWT